MGGEPEVTSQDGDKRIEGGIEHGGLKIGGNEGENNDGGGGDEVEVGTVPDGKDHREKTCAESDPKNAFVHVGHGRAPRDVNAGGKADDEEKKAEVGEGFAPRQERVL